MNIGKFISDYLIEHNLSQRQFAKRCNLSNGYISMLINNINPKTSKPLVPSLKSLLCIANGMNISLDELINNTDDINVELSSVTRKDYFKPSSEIETLYNKLDIEDKAEVRGTIKQMLKADKYKVKKSKYDLSDLRIVAEEKLSAEAIIDNDIRKTF